MHASFDIASASGKYSVEIGAGLLDAKLATLDDVIIICDQRFAEDLSRHGKAIIPVAATEEAKSIGAVEPLIMQMRQLGMQRQTRLLAVGGGVIQDIATFCASLYMRGVPWSYAPTTLLGMVDSCIGEKSSINVGPYKNLIGNIYPPTEILVDLEKIASLSPEQRVAGLCEAVKICFARGPQAFSEFLATPPAPDAQPEDFGPLLQTSLGAKKWFIEIDEFDRGERLLLNFGHTFGHAIESATNFSITHGIAVGLGMLSAIRLSCELGYYDRLPPDVARLQHYILAQLATVPEQARINRESVNEALLLERFLADKKHTRTHFAVIVPNPDGLLQRVMLERMPGNLTVLGNAFTAAFL